MKVYIGIPTYRDMTTGFAVKVFTEQLNFPRQIQFLDGDPYIGRARDVIAANFLESDCDLLGMMDADLIWTAGQWEQLIARDKDIVAGFYPKKQPKLEWVVQALPNKPEADSTGLMEVMYIGTGFMLIRRKVFERMILLYGKEIGFTDEMHPNKRRIWDFFSVGVHQPSGRYLTEDWWFCQRALDLGYKVYGDTKVILPHIGMAVYPINPEATL